MVDEAANLREDVSVLRWAPSNFDVIRVSVHAADAPAGWDGIATPTDFAADDRRLDVAVDRWVRDQWHGLLRDSEVHYDRGALPAEEPNPPR